MKLNIFSIIVLLTGLCMCNSTFVKRQKNDLHGEIIFGPMYNYNVYKLDLNTLEKSIYYEFNFTRDIKQFKNIRHTILEFYIGNDFIIYRTLSEIYKFEKRTNKNEILCKGGDFIFLEKINSLIYYSSSKSINVLNMNDNSDKTIVKLINSSEIISNQNIVRREMGEMIAIDDERIAYHNAKEGYIYLYDVKNDEIINTEINISEGDRIFTYCEWNNSILVYFSKKYYFINISTRKKKEIKMPSRVSQFNYIKELNGIFYTRYTLMGLITGETNLYFWDILSGKKIFISPKCYIKNIYYKEKWHPIQ